MPPPSKKPRKPRSPRLFARRFPENGMKLLLEDPPNVRDLLNLTPSPLVAGIDFGAMRPVKTSFVQRDYSHLECDVVLTAPSRPPNATAAETILLWLLLEHQSQPARPMPLRLLGYATVIYEYQERKWCLKHQSWESFHLQPVLPVVLCTGSRSWDNFGSLADLVDHGALFRPHIPNAEPLFLNLHTMDPTTLVSSGGFFGRLLHVVQRAQAPAERFAEVLREEVTALEAMRPADRARWLEFLSYLMALVYRERTPAEREPMRDVVETSVAAGGDRREAHAMTRTIADELREEGKKEGREEGRLQSLRDTLLFVLGKKFGKVPRTTRQRVEAADDKDMLRQWSWRASIVSDLRDVGIGKPTKQP